MICGETTEFVRLQSRTGVALDPVRVLSRRGFLSQVWRLLYPTKMGYEDGWCWFALNRFQVYKDGRVVELPALVLNERRDWRVKLAALCKEHGLCITGTETVYLTEYGIVRRMEE